MVGVKIEPCTSYAISKPDLIFYTIIFKYIFLRTTVAEICPYKQSIGVTCERQGLFCYLTTSCETNTLIYRSVFLSTRD